MVIPAISPMHRRTQALWMVLVSVSATVIAAEIPGDKELIRFEAKFGTVSFSHKAHSEQEGVQCSTCHHTHTEDSETISACHDCHIAVHYRVAQIKKADVRRGGESSPAVAKAEDAFHSLCQGCHQKLKEEGKPSGPSDSCRDCHV